MTHSQQPTGDGAPCVVGVNIGRDERRAIADYMAARHPKMTAEEVLMLAENLTIPQHAWLDLEMRRSAPRNAIDYDPFAAAYR